MSNGLLPLHADLRIDLCQGVQDPATKGSRSCRVVSSEARNCIEVRTLVVVIDLHLYARTSIQIDRQKAINSLGTNVDYLP